MSSGPQLVVQMSSDEAKLYQGMQKLIEQQKKFEEGVGKVGKEARLAEQELKKFAEHTKDLNTTPVERYRQEMARLDAALKKSLLTQEDFRRAKIRLQSEFLKPFETKKQTEDLDGVVGKWVSIGGAIGIARAALQQYTELQQRSIDITENQAESRMDLAQIATSPQHLAELERRADLMATQHGIPRTTARTLIGNATNFDLLNDTGFLNKAARAQGVGLAQADLTVYTGGKISSMLGGEVTADEAANMAFAAAQKSPLTFAQMAPSLPAAVSTGKGAGATPDEIIGLSGFLAKKFKSGEEGSERFARLFAETSGNDKYRGKSAIEQIQMLRKLKYSQQKDIIGDSMQARATLNQFTSDKDMEEALQFVAETKAARETTGTAQDVINKQIGITTGGDELTGGKQAARQRYEAAKQSRELQDEQRSEDVYARKEATEVLQKLSLKRSDNALSQLYDSSNRAWQSTVLSTDQLQKVAARQAVFQRLQGEGAPDAGAQAQLFVDSATQQEILAELARATRELANMASDARQATTSNKATLQRQGASFAEK